MQILNAELLRNYAGGVLMASIPPYYNFRIRRLCNTVLQERNREGIDEAWRKLGIATDYTKLCDLIVAEFWWCNNLFHPDDECYVLWKCWRKKFIDDMELECLLVRIQKELKCDIPEDALHVTFCDPKLTLRQFFETVIAHRKRT